MGENRRSQVRNYGCDKLPSLPHVLLYLIDSSTHMVLDERLYDAIHLDPALCIKLLNSGETDWEGIINSKVVNSLDQLIDKAAIQQFFSRYTHERIEFLKQHWYHSVFCAELARQLATAMGYENTEQAYLAGLIHDIGQLALEVAHPEEYTATFARLSEGEYFHELEKEAFDDTHVEIGARLLAKLGVDQVTCDAVLYHHEPPELLEDTHPLCRITCIANLLSDVELNDEDKGVFDAASSLIGIEHATARSLIEDVRNKMSKISEELDFATLDAGADGQAAKKLEARDQMKQVLLADRVRTIALLDNINQQLRGQQGLESIVNTLEDQLRLLFGIEHCFLFRENDGELSLTVDTHDHVYIREIKIDVTTSQSVLAVAYDSHETTESTGDPGSAVVDRQIARAGNSDGVICLPLIDDGVCIGVLVLCVSYAQRQQIHKNTLLLARLTSHLATLLINDEASADKDSGASQRNRKLAHEIRNPLSIINNYLEILSHRLDDDTEAEDDISTIRGEIRRIGGLLDRLTQPASSSDISSTTDVNRLIEEHVSIIQHGLADDRSIQIDLELDPQMPEVTTDQDALKQILTNLLKNAVEALSANGRIMVYTSGYVYVEGRRYFGIEVSDNGPGIASEVLPDLFTPVTSTKGGKHSGLGLSIVKELIDTLDGQITCSSNSRGTRFHIRIPV